MAVRRGSFTGVAPTRRLKGTVHSTRLESNCRVARQQLSGGRYNRRFWLDGSPPVGKNGNASKLSRTAQVRAVRHALPNRLTWAVLIGFMLAASIAVAQEPASWKTGPAFRRQLDAIENVAWPDSVLRDGLVRLSQAYGVAVFLDRRIDPGQSVTLTVRDAP